MKWGVSNHCPWSKPERYQHSLLWNKRHQLIFPSKLIPGNGNYILSISERCLCNQVSLVNRFYPSDACIIFIKNELCERLQNFPECSLCHVRIVLTKWRKSYAFALCCYWRRIPLNKNPHVSWWWFEMSSMICWDHSLYYVQRKVKNLKVSLHVFSWSLLTSIHPFITFLVVFWLIYSLIYK